MMDIQFYTEYLSVLSDFVLLRVSFVVSFYHKGAQRTFPSIADILSCWYNDSWKIFYFVFIWLLTFFTISAKL